MQLHYRVQTETSDTDLAFRVYDRQGQVAIYVNVRLSKVEPWPRLAEVVQFEQGIICVNKRRMQCRTKSRQSIGRSVITTEASMAIEYGQFSTTSLLITCNTCGKQEEGRSEQLL